MRSRDQEYDRIRAELERMRRDLSPQDYARESARLLKQLEQSNNKRPRYAVT